MAIAILMDKLACMSHEAEAKRYPHFITRNHIAIKILRQPPKYADEAHVIKNHVDQENVVNTMASVQKTNCKSKHRHSLRL